MARPKIFKDKEEKVEVKETVESVEQSNDSQFDPALPENKQRHLR